MNETLTSPTRSKRWLTQGVLGIGLASLFSDWGHEAATAILPAFLVSLGAPAVALGIVEGVSDGLSSFAKLAGGFIADRPSWRKCAGIVGYLATALTTFAYAFLQSWPALLLVRALGWMGRGERGPSRDTLLADSVAPEQEGRAFGFERAMDTLGAVLGPLSATALLGVVGVRGVLAWTLLPGATAALTFALLVPSGKAGQPPRAETASLRARMAQLPNRSGIFWPAFLPTESVTLRPPFSSCARARSSLHAWARAARQRLPWGCTRSTTRSTQPHLILPARSLIVSTSACCLPRAIS